jgi:NADH-quinone oxidoreductase subunit J
VANALFYLMAILAVAGALGVVLAKNPIQCILSLLGSFACLAVIYLLAGFQFLAAAQILVYAGAILVLFLFVIMLLNLAELGVKAEQGPSLFHGTAAKIGIVVAVAIGIALSIWTLSGALRFSPVRERPEGIDGMSGIAAELFGRYGLPFEAMSVLLLATMVAVVLLAKRQRGGREKEQA